MQRIKPYFLGEMNIWERRLYVNLRCLLVSPAMALFYFDIHEKTMRCWLEFISECLLRVNDNVYARGSVLFEKREKSGWKQKEHIGIILFRSVFS